MCGIAGLLAFGPLPEVALRARVAAALALLHHRGPDAAGVHVASLRGCTVALGATRLRVVGEACPLPLRDGAVTVALNGEVYNWRELRAELSDGTPWQTQCDTEVLARLWRVDGPLLDRLNGMFSLAVLDEAAGRLRLARDRAGEKPLFLAETQIDGVPAVAWASEIKALRALGVELREVACPELATLEADCLDGTPFAGVRRMPPGTCLDWNLPDPEPLERQWWTLSTEVDEDLDVETAAEELLALLRDAVRLRLSDEVPVALLLSGGLDSAVVQAIAQCDRLYCATWPGEIDNLTPALLASGGRSVVPVSFDLAGLRAALPEVAYHLDTPATWTAVAQWFLAQRIAADGATVVLSGEGADELLGGYSRYRLLWWLDQAAADEHLRLYRPTRELLVGSDDDVLATLLNRGGPATLDHAPGLVARYGGAGPLTRRMARVDWHTTMQVLLRMADRMFAAHSLENRAPFLDYRVIELCARMPERIKITAGESKHVLRIVARWLGVPDQIVDERSKRGLVLPWGRWTGTAGARGQWDRAGFAAEMTAAWRTAFGLPGQGRAQIAA